MVYRNWDRFDEDTKRLTLERATDYLTKIEEL
jgi:hypothetical protein